MSQSVNGCLATDSVTDALLDPEKEMSLSMSTSIVIFRCWYRNLAGALVDRVLDSFPFDGSSFLDELPLVHIHAIHNE